MQAGKPTRRGHSQKVSPKPRSAAPRLAAAELPRGADAPTVPILALPGMLWMLGVLWHLDALRQAARRRTRPAALLAQALAVLVLF